MTTRFFTSWVRRGAAAGIIEPDPTSGPYAGPAKFQPVITLARDGAPQAPLSGPELPLLGPGAVVGLDPRAVLRTDPATGAQAVEDNHLVLAELARPDLPWLFTPAKPSAANRLRPWLVLVVVEASRLSLEAGTPLARITVHDSELPDLSDSWAWVHAQVTAETDDPREASALLKPPSGSVAVSRLLCPRRLQPDRSYLACLVPATLVGVQAGLGLPLDPGPALAPAWTVGSGHDVVLPVYYSWTFSTGDFGDFKSLVERLRGVHADSIPGFGTRTIDMSSPWESPPQLGDGVETKLAGALRAHAEDPSAFSDATVGAAFETRLTNLLNFPADLTPATSTGDPKLSAVAPPIYAGRHAGEIRVPADAGWLRTLNLDPRRRIAAAFGAQYVQENKEFLMARAWDQLGAVQEANRLRALAELAAEVADRLHVRHIQTLGPSELLSMAAPARTRVLVGAATTLQATTATTPLPEGAGTVAFSRLSSPLGPLGRRAFARATPTVVERGLSGAVRVAPPATSLDGLVTMATPPPPTADATGRMFARAWQGVTATDQSVPNPGDLAQLRLALDGAVTTATGVGFAGGLLPILIGLGPPPVAVDPPPLAAILTSALVPSIRIMRRLQGRIRVPEALGGTITTTPVMACPQFTAPLAMALMRQHREYLLPGLGKFPNDRVTLLVANAAFVESVLAGANHEMNRELLWREYPTDQRGTPFQYFWPRPDGNPDIPPITAWSAANVLGTNGAANGPDVESMVVLLVRGEVLRRYPRTIVYAAPGRIDGDGKLTLDTSVQWTAPQFLLRLDSTTTAFAYPLTEAVVRGIPGFYFVFSEPVTGPRFKFNEASGNPFDHWTDLGWDLVIPASQNRGFAIAGVDVTPPSQETDPSSPRWNKDAADIARIAFARPFRVGYHADELLAGA
jgi:hypothetical protein